MERPQQIVSCLAFLIYQWYTTIANADGGRSLTSDPLLRVWVWVRDYPGGVVEATGAEAGTFVPAREQADLYQMSCDPEMAEAT